MSNDKFKSVLIECFEENGCSSLLNSETVERFVTFADFLIETSKITNLTAILDTEGIVLKHFLDSASICGCIPENSSVIDVGCGAGFPSVPLAIVRPDIQITSLDSTAKKVTFVNESIEKLCLGNIKAVCARAEEFADAHREKFDVSVSRAVARLNILSELCLPLTKVGGLFVAMKSNKGQEEYTEAENGIRILGGTLYSRNKEILSYGDLSVERETYIFKKTTRTAKIYPRKYAQILKKPL